MTEEQVAALEADMKVIEQSLASLGAKPALEVLLRTGRYILYLTTSLQELKKAFEERELVNAERLKQAGLREAKLKEENTTLSSDNTRLKLEMDRMESHPEVRAARKAKLMEQIKLLSKQHAAIPEPEQSKTE